LSGPSPGLPDAGAHKVKISSAAFTLFSVKSLGFLHAQNPAHDSVPIL
jgi:hypothetical protein